MNFTNVVPNAHVCLSSGQELLDEDDMECSPAPLRKSASAPDVAMMAAGGGDDLAGASKASSPAGCAAAGEGGAQRELLLECEVKQVVLAASAVPQVEIDALDEDLFCDQEGADCGCGTRRDDISAERPLLRATDLIAAGATEAGGGGHMLHRSSSYTDLRALGRTGSVAGCEGLCGSDSEG
jgi:hypothetical protein